MFDALIRTLDGYSRVTYQPRGVAFLKAIKELYQLERAAYVCANVPVSRGQNRYSHCILSDSMMSQWISAKMVDERLLEQLDLGCVAPIEIIRPRRRFGETAAFVIEPKCSESLNEQLRILAGFFHQQMLRLNGHSGGDRCTILSDRERDCLKWTAEGKTAWETSVILGISERTVRFHLNEARVKLECSTTVQAVAKALMNDAIEPVL